MAEVDLFSKELRTVYDRDARHKRRQTLCNLQFWALVIFSILFLIWTMWTSGHIPRGWTAAILFPSLLLFFFELFLCKSFFKSSSEHKSDPDSPSILPSSDMHSQPDRGRRRGHQGQQALGTARRPE
ncbi:hypothetical protein FB45DRAFT_435878 [Roridomyces roridus]|uniref:Uncharacterized protein n=1 Tax=Roridomyces roridus TaxID=1738132 RepID=A0AAD7B0T8_9AGAR|nr:hypothetical protein FB45DRAFT_435878 [Roridomyces roridus]